MFVKKSSHVVIDGDHVSGSHGVASLGAAATMALPDWTTLFPSRGQP